MLGSTFRLSGNFRDRYPDLGVRACPFDARSHPQIRSHSTAKSGEPCNRYECDNLYALYLVCNAFYRPIEGRDHGAAQCIPKEEVASTDRR